MTELDEAGAAGDVVLGQTYMDMGHLPETPEVVVEVDVVGDTAHEHPISLWKQ
jgi:hypothetical protein